MKLEFTDGGLFVNLKAKQGRNQKGLCFVSEEESALNEGVYKITSNGKTLLADIRTSASVPNDMIILDQRIFQWLSCRDEEELTLEEITSKIPSCTEIRLLLSSTRNLDNRTIADAISKRVNDLHDDFDGLILQTGQSFQIDRLGIRFSVKSLSPKDPSNHAARISWTALEKIHLDPIESVKPFNVVCIFEIGAAAQIFDVGKDGNKIPRYEAAIEAIKQVSEIYLDSGTKAQFSGYAYSDEIIPFTMFDPQTGKPIEQSSIHSATLFIGFTEWIESLIPNHKGRPSNPGEALQTGLDSAKRFESNSMPTIILFLSSGVHTSGPNPVKIAKSYDDQPILCFVPGKNSNHDVMDAIAETSHGKAIIVTEFEDIENIIDALLELTGGGS
ncbi:MAG: hypothetical protein RTU63_05225 [Candidatus Thorarchaeota archaeon]